MLTKAKGAYCRPCWTSKVLATRARFIEKNPEKYKRQCKDASLKALYGVSIEDYERIFAAQNGACAICGSSDSKAEIGGKKVKLHVDHCHSTGQVRGLLCAKCNLGLGSFEDSPDFLRAAADYLESAMSKTEAA